MPSSTKLLPLSSRPRAGRLLGRARELGAIASAFAEAAGLVTLVGPPGVGKSRLARAFAGDYGLREPVCFVDLADVARVEDALAVMAGVLGITAAADAAAARIGAVLRGRGAGLVVLDDADRVASQLGEVVAAWTREAPRLRLLTTSRSRIGARGERLLEVPPLDVEAAITLFRRRAAAARSGGGGRSSDDAEVVRALVEAFDRVPLAVEVVAARAAMLSPQKILERIGTRVGDVLRAGPAHGSADRRRHASLGAAITLSWELLAEDERHTLQQCAAFVRSFSAEAAEASVLGAGDVVGALAGLVERSLVQRFEPEAMPGEPRFRLYESVRAFALQRLTDAGERAATEARIDTFVVAEAERLAGELNGIQGSRASICLELDRDNLLAASRRTPRDAPDRAARAGLALSALAALHGLSDTKVHDATIEAARRAGDPALLGAALVAFGDAGGRLGLVEPPRQALDEAIALAEASALHLLAAKAKLARGRFFAQHGDFARAAQDLAEADEALARAGGDAFVAGCVRNVEGCIAEIRGDYGGAVEAFERALGCLRRASSPRMEAAVLSNLGVVRHAEGRIEDARALLERALTLARRTDNRTIEADALLNLGSLHLSVGRLDEAEPLLLVALARQRELGHARFEGLALANLAMVAHDRGELRAARDRYQEALDRLRACGEARFSAMALPFFAAAEAALGLLGEARADFAAARALPAGMDPAHEGVLDALEGFLDLAAAREASGAAIVEEARGRARARLVRATARLGAERSTARSAELALAVRLLTRALDGGEPLAAPAIAAAKGSEVAARALVVGPDHRWFSLADGPVVDLAKRGKLRLVLAEIAGQRVAAPGVGVPAARLFEVAWPGQRALQKAAADRVYNAVATLRRLGLDAVLRRQDDGYLLDPDVAVQRR